MLKLVRYKPLPGLRAAAILNFSMMGAHEVKCELKYDFLSPKLVLHASHIKIAYLVEKLGLHSSFVQSRVAILDLGIMEVCKVKTNIRYGFLGPNLIVLHILHIKIALLVFQLETPRPLTGWAVAILNCGKAYKG